MRLEVTAPHGTQQPFGHLRARGITGAKKQDTDWLMHINSLSAGKAGH
jgi:hypothetical protein